MTRPLHRSGLSDRYRRELGERNRRIREGLCAKCGKPNDRLIDAMRKSNKEGKCRITQCNACVSASKKHGKNAVGALSKAEREYLEAQLANPRWW